MTNHLIEDEVEFIVLNNEIVNTDEYRIILLTSPTCLHCKNYKKSVNYVCDENNIFVYKDFRLFKKPKIMTFTI